MPDTRSSASSDSQQSQKKRPWICAKGSDGTDCPTDAVGGIVAGSVKETLNRYGLTIEDILKNNNAYHTLEKANGLIITGPTGTNVNDVAVVLIGQSADT